MTFSRKLPLAWMSSQYSAIARRAERAEQAGAHDLRETDDGVERRPELVADIGEEGRLRLVGARRRGSSSLGVFGGELDIGVRLPLELLLCA